MNKGINNKKNSVKTDQTFYFHKKIDLHFWPFAAAQSGKASRFFLKRGKDRVFRAEFCRVFHGISVLPGTIYVWISAL